MPHSMSPRGNSQGDLGESPAHKKSDNKGSPMTDRTPPRGMDPPRHFMEQMHMRNWLIHRFNEATGYNTAITQTWIFLYDATGSHESTSSTGRSRQE